MYQHLKKSDSQCPLLKAEAPPQPEPLKEIEVDCSRCGQEMSFQSKYGPIIRDFLKVKFEHDPQINYECAKCNGHHQDDVVTMCKSCMLVYLGNVHSCPPPRSGHQRNFILWAGCKISLNRLDGKPMTPRRRNTTSILRFSKVVFWLAPGS